MLQAWHWCGTDARRKVIGIFQQGLVRSRSYQLCLRRVVDGPSPCYSALEICLLGRCFLVRTDYRSLRHLLHQKLLHLHNNFGWPNFWVMISWSNTKLGLLILLLTHYLDRRRMVPSWPYLVCLVWRRSNPIWGGAGPFLLSIIKELHCDPNAHLHCILLGGHLYDKGLLVISEASPWISKLLQEFHSNPTRRHSGAFHTYRRLAATLYWRNMMRSAQQYLAACLLSASTIWGCFSHRPSPTTASSRFDLGRYSHGFYHSLTQVPRLWLHPCRRWLLVQICLFSTPKISLYCSLCHRTICSELRPFAWDSSVHCKWQGSCLCEFLLARIV